jgi:glucosamine-phosphate N-acetyltransferase
MEVTFRLVTPDDFGSGFLEVLNQLAPVRSYDEKHFHDVWKEMVTQGKHVYVGEIEGKVVCTGTLLLERKLYYGGCYFGHIEDVVVDEGYRGKGIGLKLIKWLIEDAKSNNCALIVLDCMDDKVDFYIKSGFYRRGNQMNLDFQS